MEKSYSLLCFFPIKEPSSIIVLSPNSNFCNAVESLRRNGMEVGYVFDYMDTKVSFIEERERERAREKSRKRGKKKKSI